MYKKFSAEVNYQISFIMNKVYENALNKENIILTRPERQRLFFQNAMMVVDMLKKIEDSTSSS
jgi:hypothetical protein